jgi:glycosyltransferase involved in cell wall biosynthesis
MDGYARVAAQEIDAGGYDVAFIHDCRLVQNPDVLRHLATPSVAYCHHGAGATLPLPAMPVLGFRRRVAEAYYALPKRAYPWVAAQRAKANIRCAGKVLTNSAFARERLQRAYGVDSRVCYLGVDTDRFRPLGLARERFVLSVGAVHYHKGYRFLVRALGCMPEAQRPPLVIAANAAETEEHAVLMALARQAGVQLQIVRVTDQEELVALYNRASAFVYTPILEPWGLAGVEALACGAPVVAVGEGGVRESMVDGETALLVERDAAAFAEAVGRVLRDRALACRLGRAGAAYVRRHFTWEATTAQVEQQLAEGVVTQ